MLVFSFFSAKCGNLPALNLSLVKVVQIPPGTGDSHIKVTGMLVVSLRCVNCRFWSHLVFSSDGVGVGVVIRSVELI